MNFVPDDKFSAVPYDDACTPCHRYLFLVSTRTFLTQESTGRTGDAAASAGEKSGPDFLFLASDEQLSEGAVLLHKIRRTTSAPAQIDGCTSTPKSRALPHPGVRHRVEVCSVLWALRRGSSTV